MFNNVLRHFLAKELVAKMLLLQAAGGNNNNFHKQHSMRAT
jgi:hypothetical protein